MHRLSQSVDNRPIVAIIPQAPSQVARTARRIGIGGIRSHAVSCELPEEYGHAVRGGDGQRRAESRVPDLLRARHEGEE